jgi:coenzyme F420 hydrogenase subunit beta
MPAKEKFSFVELTERLGGQKTPLCHFCGTCITVCPTGALSIGGNEKPLFDKSKCKPCGLCYNFCSGWKVDYDGIKGDFFSACRQEEILGPYLNTYIAYSTNPVIRKKGSSGGMVTGLLSYALDAGMIDGAVVVGRNDEKPWLPKIRLVKTTEELQKCAQSKYCYIPTNAFLRELWDKLDGKTGRYAIVALPCQIHAMRQMQRQNVKYVKNIKYMFGLICGYNMHYEATDFVRKKLKIKYDEVDNVKYRDLGWPGGMTFYLKSGEKRGIDLFHYHYLNAVFLPTRCRIACSDFFADFADISFGDSWLKNLYSADKENLGWSSIITRTADGEELLRNAFKEDRVLIEEVEKEKITGSFPYNIKYKKKGILIRLKMARHKAEYNGGMPVINNMKTGEKLYHIFYNLLLIFGATRFFKKAIYLVPFEQLRNAIQLTKRIMGYPENARDVILREKKKSVYKA